MFQADRVSYLEGQGDLVLVSRLIVRITRVTIWDTGVINLLTQFPDPPSTQACTCPSLRRKSLNRKLQALNSSCEEETAGFPHTLSAILMVLSRN